MLRLIIWLIIFFLVFRIIRIIVKSISSVPKEQNPMPRRKKESNYRIKEEDIIEAKFEEIKPKAKDNSKDNS